MENRKKIKIGIVVLLVILTVFLGAMLGAGGDGYAEQYEFNVDTAQLINAVKTLKKANRNLSPPNELKLLDSYDTLTRRYNVNLYLPEKNSVLYFYINTDGTDSFVNLVSINQGFVSPVYKIINKDFGRKENLEIKSHFEEVFLKKLKMAYEDKGNNMFIFWK